MKESTHQKYLLEEEDEEERPQALTVQPMQILNNKALTATRAEDAVPHREELYYSES